MGLRLSSLINIAFHCFPGALLVSQGLLLTVNALVLQVGLPRQSESGLGHQCPYFRPRHLGHLVRSWEGFGGDGAQVYLWWWSLRLLDGVWRWGPFLQQGF